MESQSSFLAANIPFHLIFYGEKHLVNRKNLIFTTIMNVKRTRTKLVVITLLSGILLLLSSVFIYQYTNKEQVKTQLFHTQAHLTPNEFISLFDTVNSGQAKEYVDKAIEIKGVLEKVTLRGGTYTLFINSNKEGRFIQCEMQNDQIQKIEDMVPKEIVTVKGIFKGVLLDAILLNCVIIE
jgi:uncharacterized integral membrane protein